ncbi:MAG: Chaperone protein DnaJ [Firmicutes bacterium ADurb.Bin182]|nr:MAG: Chaperone protein DnaJ [Firmicutes bacterium ADurb.Bin182]
MNPYKVLGVSETASQEEIRAAYLALVKKYHPDRYADNPLKELANEKLKEINEAYEALSKKGSGTSSRTSYGSYESSAGFGGAYSGPFADEFAKARSYISQNNLQAAKLVLDGIPVRNAEWHYLYGIIYLRQGWYDKAREYLGIAYEQEPGNAEYRNAFTALNNSGNPYGRGPYQNTTGYGGSCSGCDVCTSLICADCCCECLGGDLIRCC